MSPPGRHGPRRGPSGILGEYRSAQHEGTPKSRSAATIPPTLLTPAAAADAVWRELQRTACAPYRAAGRFAWHFARGKLGRDPVFRGLLERGDLPPGARVLDIGCGQGLLASLLAAIDAIQAAGRWPARWPAAPTGTRYTGIELMARDVARAQAAVGHAVGHTPGAPRFVCADMCTAELPACDVVVILDVLHYVPPAAQESLLTRVRDALLPRGRLLLRVGDAANRRGFAASQWVDRGVALVRGHRAAPTFGRPLDEWTALLARLGFVVNSVPMSRGTPFANVLLVADLARRGAANSLSQGRRAAPRVPHP